MELTSLYETLDLKPGCDADAIKAAHRRLAKQYHPDVVKDGDVERFLAVTTAYRVLSDPDRRKRYDDDGTYDDGAVQSEQQRIASNLAGVFSRLLDSGEATDPTVSVINAMKKIIRDGNAKMRRAMDEMDLELKKLQSVRETITRKDEDRPNLFANVIDVRATKVSTLRDQAQAECVMGEKMLAELGQYDSFARAARSQAYFGFANTGSTSSTTGGFW